VHSASLALLGKTMTAIINHKRKKTGSEMLPFGKRKTIFISDLAQLCQAGGAAIYDDRSQQ